MPSFIKLAIGKRCLNPNLLNKLLFINIRCLLRFPRTLSRTNFFYLICTPAVNGGKLVRINCAIHNDFTKEGAKKIIGPFLSIWRLLLSSYPKEILSFKILKSM
jgi:hypothetical protein